MRNIMGYIFVLLLVVGSSNNILAQDFIIFSDSPTKTSYDPSWGYVKSPSKLERVGEKFPVDSDHAYSGENSLRLKWTSESGGDWGIAAAKGGWPGHDLTEKDSLTFWVFSEAAISSVNLPVVYLEDLNNKKTGKIKLSDHAIDLQANQWQKISVPLSVFVSNSAQADLTKIKTVFYGQNAADATENTMYIDEIRFVAASSNVDTTPPSVPASVSAKGFNKHIDISWELNTEKDIYQYKIYKLEGEEYKLLGTSSLGDRFYTDFIGSTSATCSYKVSAVDSSENESDLSMEVTANTKEMNDEELLTMLQESTFRYFWDYAHPVSGLTRERNGSGNTVTSGGSGFGIMALLVGIERGFITREQGIERILKILIFLDTKAEKFHGAFSHWLDGETGKAIAFSEKDDGGDLVETAFLIQGLLTVRSYFDKDNTDENKIKTLVTKIWEGVEWDWYRRTPTSNHLYWHWSPNYGWEMNFALSGPNEVMITYLLAIASPTHAVSASLYHDGWAGSSNYLNGKSFYGYKLDVGWDYGGPLFFAHYSYLGFDPRNKKDAYTNYFENNKNHTLINRAYCIENPKNFAGYDENTWGLTASDDPFGYLAHEPIAARDNGTITPTAALSSMPYTPKESIAAFKNFYDKYGKDLWGIYGFKDAFNVQHDWYANSFLAIDQGPIIIMVENYRSQLLWDNFMANPEIKPLLDTIGFVEDLVNVEETEINKLSFQLKNNYPNPFNPSTVIEYTIPERGLVSLKVYDVLGREVAELVRDEQSIGLHKVEWNAANISSGVYVYKLSVGNYTESKRMVLLK